MPYCPAARRDRLGVALMAQQETELVTKDLSIRVDATLVLYGNKWEVGCAGLYATLESGQWFLLEQWEPETTGEDLNVRDWAVAHVRAWTQRL